MILLKADSCLLNQHSWGELRFALRSVALLLYCSIALLLSALRSIALKNTGLPRLFQRLAMTVIPQTYAVAQTKTIPFSLISVLLSPY